MKLRNETIAWNTNVDWKVNSSQCVHYRDVFLFSFMCKLVISIVWRFSTTNFSANIFPSKVEKEKNSINFGKNQLQEKFRNICLPWFVSSIAKLPHPVYTCLYLIVLRFWRAYLGYYKQGKLYKKRIVMQKINLYAVHVNRPFEYSSKLQKNLDQIWDKVWRHFWLI